MDEERRLTRVADLCLRVGDVLMGSGAGAADVTATMELVARTYGVTNPDLDVTFTSLSISLDREDEQQPVVLIRTVKRRDLDYERLTEVDRLVRAVVEGRVELEDARQRMRQIVSSPRALPRWAVTAAWGTMCAAVSTYLGGGVLVAVVAFVAAVLIERTQASLSAHRLPGFYLQVAGGAIAALIAVALEATGADTDASLVVTANIVMLLAGIGFMGAIQDALTGFYLTASARLLEAVLATAGIIAGVSGGLTVGLMLGVEVPKLVPGFAGWAGLPAIVLGGAVSAAAFAVACRAPRRSWVPIGVISLVAALVHQGVLAADAGRPWAAGFAAFFVGLVAYGVSGRIRVPPLVVVVACVVPFLPGLSIYRALALMPEGHFGAIEGVLNMVTAASVAVALSAGVILGEYVAQPVKREARRLEDRLAGPRLVGVFRPRSRSRA